MKIIAEIMTSTGTLIATRRRIYSLTQGVLNLAPRDVEESAGSIKTASIRELQGLCSFTPSQLPYLESLERS
jgi:hypothetical protein